MRHMWEQHRYVVCPHGAIAIHARRHIAKDLHEPSICVLTAHPAKFEDTVQAAIGTVPRTVPAVEALKKLPNHHFKWLRKQGPHWRADWIREIKDAVELSSQPAKL